jgi:hypothetical protein
MVEISFWNPGDEKTRIIYSLDDLDTVMRRIEDVNSGKERFAVFSHPTRRGAVYIPSSVLRECVTIVTDVGDSTPKSLVL